MSNLASIVTAEGRFENVKVHILTDIQFDSKQFASLNQSQKTVRLVAIDQADNILMRFFEHDKSNPNGFQRQNGQNFHANNSSHFTNNSSQCQVNPPVHVSYAATTAKNSGDRNGTQATTVQTQQSTNNSAQNVTNESVVYETKFLRDSECIQFLNNSVVLGCESRKSTLVMILFSSGVELDRFIKMVQGFKKQSQISIFNQRTDETSATQYFQFYGYLSQQQNMMQDYVRTSTYQKAMLTNAVDFQDKVVLDVGAGSGILSFFALQAGARKVYAVEASSMAKHAQFLVQANGSSGRIEVVAGKIEEIELPEKVDVIISEPMGYMLVNERMLETFLHAKKFFRPNEGLMFPSRGDLHIAPFTDAQLYMEQSSKANFWFSKDFHGIDLRALHSAATNEYFRQPIVDTFDIRICMSKTIRHIVDFQGGHETDLHCISIPLEFVANQTGHIHGLAFWFDVAFIGSQQTVWLSTAPSQPLTHWYQVRCLVSTPLFVNKGQVINGSCVLTANKRQSYDVEIELFIKGLGTRSTNTLDLKNPYFRYTGQPVHIPPGGTDISPSEQIWSTTMATDPYQTNSVAPNILVGNQTTSTTTPNQPAT